MDNRKIEAIRTLENAFKHMPEYKKKWQDYIELRITEVLEECGIKDIKRISKIRSQAAQRILGLFDTDWWEAQQSIKK